MRSTSSVVERLALALSLSIALSGVAAAKKQAGPPKKKEKEVVASEQTVRAIGELAGKFQWGATPEDVTKIVSDEIEARFDEKIKKESSPYKQDALRKEMSEQILKFKGSFVKFEGQATGWDVSIIDREFAHKNDESMLVIWEKDQRRFLFFYQGHLWKQFIAFNAEHPAFAGKTFDDFANVIQKRYGPASMTFRKLRTSDDQTLDHLEWPPAGDYVLWAIDLTTFYGNFCLSLMQKTKVDDIQKGRDLNSPKKSREGHDIVDSVMNDKSKGESNADIVDEVTGRPPEETPAGKPSSASKPSGKGDKKKPEKERDEPKTADPLEGTGF